MDIMDKDRENDRYIGKRLEGRYEIQELIGMGGMANVYKAFDSIDQRTVAVKILRDEFLGNDEFLRRFKNESKAIAVLSHPNIVRVYDVSFQNHVHSIVMEHIDGITLKDYIERQTVLSWKEAIHFTLQILRALQHAHDKGIVHRDIKPHNIMLLQNGNIKVTDFGIAQFARSEVKTITDRAIGSVHYISPEQAMGEMTDEKSDIYSVGVMLFEMLTGRLPFEADTAVSVAIKQIQTQAVRPTSINPSIPEGLEHITLRAMQKDAGLRYQSAAEMIADIEKFKENPSIQFAYKYLDNESSANISKRFRRAVSETREDEDMVVKRKKTPYIPILTGVTLAFVLASIGFIALMVYLNNPFTQVPDIAVPTLIGTKIDTAIRTNENIEIKIEDHVFSSDFAKDVICEQNPKADSLQIKEGSVVKVKVSKGPQKFIMENYANRSANQVMQKLQESGLEPREIREYSDTVPAGSVIGTDPSMGAELSSGDIVTVYVSNGPEKQLAEVPSDLIGMNVEQANQLLQFSTLRIGNISEEPSDKPAGTIIAVDPDVGSMVEEGASLNVVISKGGESSVTLSVPLPNVKETFTVRMYDEDNNLLAKDTIDPTQQQVWNPELSGEEGTVLTVKIYISTEERSGKLWQTYEVDFETGEHLLDRDYSDSPNFDWD